MATTVTDEIADVAAQAAGASPKQATKLAHSAISASMLQAVKGFGWQKPVTGTQAIPGTSAFTGGSREISAKETTKRAFRAEQSLRETIRKSMTDPEGVRKNLSPSFIAEYPLFGTNYMPQDQAIGQLQSQMGELMAGLGKSFTTGTPVSTGLVPFDLEAPSHLLYWFDTPLRAKLPRLPGRGSSHRTKVITAITGSQTSASAPITDPTLSEITNFSSWPNSNLGPSGTQVGVDVNIGYSFLGRNENLSWLAQFAGVGFEDITSLANLILMHEAYFDEEYLNIAGSSHAITAPASVSLTVRTAVTGETAISNGDGTHNWVTASACNYYGETANCTAVDAGAISTSQVVDVVITPGTTSAGQQFRLYFQIAGTPFARATAAFVAQCGGTKYTLQGAMPSNATTPHPLAADSGTGASTRWDGLISVISGSAAANSVYPAGFLGSYVNTNVQAMLSLNVLNTALKGMYDNSNAYGTGAGAFRASPEELVCEGFDSANLSSDVAKNSSGTNYQLLIQQGDMAGVLHGTAVSQVVNPVTRRIVNITVHPGWLQGTAVLTQWTTPQAARNGNVFEMRMCQDLLSVAWPVIDPTYRYSIFEYGTFFAQAPQYSGLLSGLQVNASNPWS
jgi:hypothetical protein